MITKKQAEQIIYNKINMPNSAWGNMPEMIVTEIVERPYGWIFYYTSKIFHDTRDFKYAIAGNLPYYVSKNDGLVYILLLPINESIVNIEKQLIKA